MLNRTVALAVVVLGLSPAAATVRVARPVASASNVRPVVVPVVPLALNLAPSAGLQAGLAPTLSATNDAPNLAARLRAEAAETVAQWRASRAPASAVAVSAPSAAPSPILTPAEAIATAQSSDQALSRLVGLGIIQPAHIPEGETDRVALLKRVWDGVSTKLTSEVLPVDDAWAVPAISVQRDGKTYLIHGVAHGQLYPPNRRQVTRLVSQIEKQGHALLTEQNLPAHYGFAYGQETMDKEVDRHGVPARVTAAAAGLETIAQAHALMRGGALGVVGYAWVHTALNPSDPLAWLLAVGAMLGLWLLARGLQPLNRLSLLSAAHDAERLGSKDLAAHLRREARAFFGPRGVKAEDILRLHLPPGPGAASDSLSPRSAAIAGAALAASASVVHVLVGYRHAAEIAWRLAGADVVAGTASSLPGAAASERNGGSVTKPLFFGVLGAVAMAFGLAQMNTGYMLAGGFWLASALWDYLNKDKPAEVMTVNALLGYPPRVYLMMAAALVTALAAPVAAPFAVIGLAGWSALTSKTARESFDASQDLFTLSIGFGVGALLGYGLNGFGLVFLAAGFAAVLANVIGKFLKYAAIRKS